MLGAMWFQLKNTITKGRLWLNNEVMGKGEVVCFIFMQVNDALATTI